MRFLGLFLLMTSTTLAGEYAVLSSGGRLHVDRHEADGAKVRLFHGTGFVEMDANLVRGFEDDGLPLEVPVPAPESVKGAPALAPEASLPVVTPLQLADAAADRYGLPRELVRS